MSNSWIDLDAVGKILGIGLLLGAGLPAVFAVGIRALAPVIDKPGEGGTIPAATNGGARAVALATAGVCFLVVLAAIAYGIELIVAS